MKIAHVVSLVFLVQIGACAGFAGVSDAADTHVVSATPRLTWKSAESESSTSGRPIEVTVNKGDIIEINIPGGTHGFVTLNKPGTDNPAEAKQFVWACGQLESDETENAVFREVQCGPSSNFATRFRGKMRLEVTDKFKDDTNFWCVEHTSGMWGVVKLKPPTP